MPAARCRIAFALSVIALVAGAGHVRGDESETTRLPIPNAGAQGKADRDIRQKYKAQYKDRTPSNLLDLSHTLHEQAAQASSDPARQYVLLREARELAIDAGDLDAALGIVHEMAQAFVLNESDIKITALTSAIDKSPDPPATLAEKYMTIAERELPEGHVDVACGAANLAGQAAQKAKDRNLMAEIRKRTLPMNAARRDQVQALTAFRKLQATPNDPALNLTVGRWLCFVENRWPEGTRLLSRCSDPGLKSLAEKEVAAPTEASAMADLADAWWEYEDAKLDIPKEKARKHAAYWYAKALPNLDGARKSTAEQRSAEFGTSDRNTK